MASYERKLRRAGVQRAEGNARRLFQVALSKMQVLEASFCATLNDLLFGRRLAIAARLLVRRMRPSMPPPVEEAA